MTTRKHMNEGGKHNKQDTRNGAHLDVSKARLGMDVRRMGMMVQVPSNVTKLTLDTPEGDSTVLEGPPALLVSAMIRAGYNVRPMTGSIRGAA